MVFWALGLCDIQGLKRANHVCMLQIGSFVVVVVVLLLMRHAGALAATVSMAARNALNFLTSQQYFITVFTQGALHMLERINRRDKQI